MELPFFSRKSWDWEVNRALETGRTGSRQFIVGASDSDAKIVETARRNMEELSSRVGVPLSIQLTQADFFELKPEYVSGIEDIQARALLVLNPPYGKRLNGKGHRAALHDLYASIILRWSAFWRGWDLLIILPRGIDVSVFGSFHPLDRISFHNGGIPVTAFIFSGLSLQ
jgi:23S rRNA G2445 N2-methylase RlmL